MPEEPSDVKREPLLRAFWVPVFGDGFRLAILLAVLAAAVRGVGMLGPQRLLWVLPVGFTLMALTPHVFFSREGRRRAGLRFPRKPMWIIGGILLGAAGAGLFYWLGLTLFGETNDNWFVSVRRGFPITPEMASLSTAQLFWIISIPSLIFSPLGEEIFFRGFLQQVVEERWNPRTGVIVDAGWFAVVHLFHHGILRIDGQVQLLPLSGAIWMVLIFGTGIMFALLRQKTASLVAPVLSHAAFNLGMNFTIFYYL
jgi:membrane protease YdiL (CAAX protease family)